VLQTLDRSSVPIDSTACPVTDESEIHEKGFERECEDKYTTAVHTKQETVQCMRILLYMHRIESSHLHRVIVLDGLLCSIKNEHGPVMAAQVQGEDDMLASFELDRKPVLSPLIIPGFRRLVMPTSHFFWVWGRLHLRPAMHEDRQGI
jgi:hypothetical protein